MNSAEPTKHILVMHNYHHFEVVEMPRSAESYELTVLEHGTDPMVITFKPDGGAREYEGVWYLTWGEVSRTEHPYADPLVAPQDLEADAEEALRRLEAALERKPEVHPKGHTVYRVRRDVVVQTATCPHCRLPIAIIETKSGRKVKLDVGSAITDDKGGCTMIGHDCTPREQMRQSNARR